jgi:hypothetical protein
MSRCSRFDDVKKRNDMQTDCQFIPWMRKEEGHKLKKIVDPDNARMPKKSKDIYIYSCACLSVLIILHGQIDLAWCWLLCTSPQHILRPYVGKMTRHICIYKRRRNIMSRHITNSKKNISLRTNLSTNLKEKRKKKKKRSTTIVAIQ